MVSHAAEPLEHGGDLAAARRRFADAPEPFLDLSTGINPYPYNIPPLPPALFERLPAADALARLTALAAKVYGAPAPACVVAAPGTQILLPLIAALEPPGRAAILGPTYAEHARAAALAGHSVIETGALRGLGDADLAILVNPNNPDGRIITKADLLALAERLGQFARESSYATDARKEQPSLLTAPSLERGGSDHRRWSREGSQAAPAPLLHPSPFTGRKETRKAGLLVVDEAFMEIDAANAEIFSVRIDPPSAHSRASGNPDLFNKSVSPARGRADRFGCGETSASLAGEVAPGNIVVLRSFGKFFGLAGLRLGFAIAAPDIAARLRASLGPWAVSGPAIAIGEAALADSAWIAATQRRLAQAAQRLDALLAGAGLDIVGGTSLFRLAQMPAAAPLSEKLGRAGILVRRFAEHPTWLRFGLPGDEAAWERLAGALIN